MRPGRCAVSDHVLANLARVCNNDTTPKTIVATSSSSSSPLPFTPQEKRHRPPSAGGPLLAHLLSGRARLRPRHPINAATLVDGSTASMENVLLRVGKLVWSHTPRVGRAFLNLEQVARKVVSEHGKRSPRGRSPPCTAPTHKTQKKPATGREGA